MDHPAIGLVLDSFHSLARKVSSASIGDIRPEKLFFVQIADAPWLDMDYLSWSRHFRNMPGQGELPLVDYVEAILRTGYRGWLSLEIFNDRFRAGSASGIAVDGRRSLRLLEDQVAARTHASATLPPRAAVRGVEFIEFAASEEEAQGLGTMLAALGFRPTARHRRKAVTRWQQGDVNIVVNCEPEGLAHSFDAVHGPSVCALGLRIANVRDALDRADALAIPRFEQAVRPDEHRIPSVTGVGGSLLYFIEDGTQKAVWRDEFTQPVESAVEAQPLGLLTTDHIAQTMHYEEFLSWLLYYLALFDVSKTPQLEIADQLGLVQSQAVESTDHSLRVTLNGSMAAQTLSARFLQHYLGAGVQHVAFRTDDILRAADAARANGLPVLEIPHNYYDDLEARFGLAPAQVGAFAARNILYDRDANGEYLQFYSRAFSKRVFFEIVERRGYESYGAANAPIRLAAQARFKA